ncbi:hypothetical protein [Candidatus Methanoperedens nitratireducens]|uniref:CHAT domain-containing protein n=1 Tax=Candidatus Methanoperedens nitratireducens TaxID=1392998 RepID=A0A284VRF1_9EURY|nr:hypothetical protein [Candidatus Methanoperedens nitroreducens]SNQ61865.1 hypothetical protein MNV_500002 [Candidatus Methanoperedens nitroreducens]
MPLANGVHILECIPKKEKLGEGATLYNFLKIFLEKDRLRIENIKGKEDFFDKLNDNNFKVVHISCHGYEGDEDGKFYIGGFPDEQVICSDEFFESDHLKGRGVIITGCKLGRAGFAKEFLERTKASSLIAPMKDIESFDVAAWCTIFYHHLFTKSGNFRDSYNYMVENFPFQGSMKWWRWKNK